MAKGVDYAFNPHPSVAALKAAGVTFVGRYISPQVVNDTNGKNLTPAECKALRAAGIGLILYAEQYAARMKEGHNAGVADARHFDGVVKALGLPGAVMYCAADWDASPAEQAGINAFLDGAAAVIGHNRVGIYGGFYPVKRALDAGKAKFAVQTVAWSGGQWDSRCHVRQGLYIRIGGVECDVLTSMTHDYGQFPRPAPPAAKPAAPARRVAPGGVSLRTLVRRESTSVARSIFLMATARSKDGGFGPAQSAYIAGEDWDAPAPKGMIYWVG